MCHANNDVWYRIAAKLDQIEYYEYVLVNTDDILAISTKLNEKLAYLDQH
jgi:hypothetical protein